MKYIVRVLFNAISSKIDIDKSKEDIYLYGIELFLYSVISTLGLVAICIISGKLMEGVIIITIYYINQTIGGGFHATTHIRCFLMMAIGLVIALLALELSINYIEIGCIILLSGFILLIFPLVLHRNKAYLASEAERMSRRARVAILIEWSVAFAVGEFGATTMILSFAIGMMLSAVSRLSAVIQTKSRHI